MSFAAAWAKSNFKNKRADFYYDLSMALDDQSDLVTEVKTLQDLANQRGQKGKSEMYGRWLRGLDSGYLVDAIKEDVPEVDLMILNAFESAGRLSDGLKFLSETVKLAARMKSSIQMAVLAPSFVLMMIFVILALHAYMLTPVLEQIYPVKDWPFMGQVLHPIAITIQHYGFYIVGLIIALVITFVVTLDRWSGPNRRKVDEYLPWSMFRDYNGALFLTSLAAMMKAGRGVVDALQTLQSMATPWMQWHITRMIAKMDEKASDPAEALDTGALPREIMDRIISYGRRSSFVEAMSMIGIDSLKRTEGKIASSSKALNTIMLVIAGLLFMVIILGTVTTGMHAQDVIRAQMR